MKKLIVNLLAAVLMAAGLVGVSGSTANAACPQYTGCATTSTTANAGVGPARRANIRARVAAAGVTPKGTVLIRVINRRTGRVVFSTSRWLRDGRASVATQQLRRGPYKAVISYNPGTRPFQASRGAVWFRV